jgi:hypothetical protein
MRRAAPVRMRPLHPPRSMRARGAAGKAEPCKALRRGSGIRPTRTRPVPPMLL